MKFIAKWKERYFSLYERSRLVSQIPAFLVALISILSLGDLIYRLFADASAEFWRNNSTGIAIAVVFQLLIAVIFGARFGSLLFAGRRAIRFSQLFWLLGIFSIYFYMIATQGLSFSEAGSNCMDCFYAMTFRYSSDAFTVIVLSYFLLSILKQILFWMISTISAVSKK